MKTKSHKQMYNKCFAGSPVRIFRCAVPTFHVIYISIKELTNKHNSISYKDLRLNNLMKLTPKMVKLFSPIKWKEERTLLRDHTRILGPMMSRCWNWTLQVLVYHKFITNNPPASSILANQCLYFFNINMLITIKLKDHGVLTLFYYYYFS